MQCPRRGRFRRHEPRQVGQEQPVARLASGNVVLSGWGASPDELTLLKQVLRGFAKTYPQIHVDYQPITGDYVPAMLAKFAARKPPDVFYIDSNVFLDWVTQGLLEPLNSYAQQSKFSSKPFYPSLLNGFAYKGKIYGYPKDWSPLAMEVNTDLAAKAGVKPAAIKTWATWRPPPGSCAASCPRAEADLPVAELGPRARVRVPERRLVPEPCGDEVDRQLAAGHGRPELLRRADQNRASRTSPPS